MKVAIALLLCLVSFVVSSPTGVLEGGYHGGYGGGGGVMEGHGHGHDKHKNLNQQYANHGHNAHGDSYGDRQLYKDVYRGEHDKRKDFSNSNRALANAHRNRQVGDTYRNSGKVDDGFHNVYHKEEYSKNKKYFDTDRDHLHRQSYNDNDHFYGDVGTRYYDDAKVAGGVVKKLGEEADRYGQRFYDDGRAEYANKNFEKDAEGYGAGYGQGYGHEGGHHGGHHLYG